MTPSPDPLTGEPSLGQPFDGIRVVEFGQFVAVPFAAQLLADGGAEVIKIEPLTGDPTRQFNPLTPGETRIFISRNRGKRSLPLNIRAPEARPVIDALLDWADVALMNFRPGLAATLGLDAETLCPKFPRLVVGNVTAFGKKGPDALLPGMDIVVQARSGLMAANGRIVDGRPASGDPVSADYMCAMSLAFGISSALLRRERSGRGGSIDVSLMHAAMTIENNQLIRSEQHDREAHQAALAELERRRTAGATHAEQADVMPSFRAPAMQKIYFRTYETGDATIAVAAVRPGLRKKMADLLGITDPVLEGQETPPETFYEALKLEAEATMRTRSSQDWQSAYMEQGIPAGVVRFPIELFDDEQADVNEMMQTVEHPSAGPMRMVGPIVKMDGDGFRMSPPTAALGSETENILLELGFNQPDIDALLAETVTRLVKPA